jgi:hypothetical protein
MHSGVRWLLRPVRRLLADQRGNAAGIIIYTITFGSVPSSATQTLYRNCATQPAYYFHAPDNATLRTAFRPGLFGSEPELFMKVGRVAEGSAAPLGC